MIKSRQAKRMARLRREFVKAMGGRCMWIHDDETQCEITNMRMLQIHHPGGREDKNQQNREIRRWKRTGKKPPVLILCANHHAIIDEKEGKD